MSSLTLNRLITLNNSASVAVSGVLRNSLKVVPFHDEHHDDHIGIPEKKQSIYKFWK